MTSSRTGAIRSVAIIGGRLAAKAHCSMRLLRFAMKYGLKDESPRDMATR